MCYCLEDALPMAEYITARTDVGLDTLHNMLFHAHAINIMLTGRRLFAEGFKLRDSGVVIPSVERNALVSNGIYRVASPMRLHRSYWMMANVGMMFCNLPSPVSVVNVGRIEGGGEIRWRGIWSKSGVNVKTFDI